MITRRLNGYIVLYRPEHFHIMKSENWNGYVYEHRYIIEQELGRSLKDDEIVHHIDEDRSNNKRSNLQLTTKSEHQTIHHGIKVKSYCIDCGVELTESRAKRCVKHSRIAMRKVAWPSKEQLENDIANLNMLAIGRKYGVSDNAVRKWLQSYSIKW